MSRPTNPESRRQRALLAGIPESTLRRWERGARPQSESVAAQARKAGLKPATVKARMRAGMTLEEALQKPLEQAAQLRAGEL